MTNTTLYDKLSQAAGRPSGFDYLRIGLSIAVIISHGSVISYGREADAYLWSTPVGPLFKMILPMFFSLSGYLVTGSFQRSRSLIQFFGLRLIRIYPALVVEVVLSAFLLGPMLTTKPLPDYFTNSLFFNYLLNATGDIHYFLPGVFANNPLPNIVNPQLWTVPFELACYVALAMLMILAVRRHPWMAFAASIAVSAVYIVIELIIHHGVLGLKIGAVHGPTLLSAFLFGVGLYLYNKRIPWNPRLCVLSGAAAYALLAIPYGEYLAVLFAAYFTMALGSFNPRKVWLLRGADYSYGVFLYGAVIQQALVDVFPASRLWWANVFLTVPIAMLVAAFSWHFVEKPALRLRTYLPSRPLRSPPEGALTEAG